MEPIGSTEVSMILVMNVAAVAALCVLVYKSLTVEE